MLAAPAAWRGAALPSRRSGRRAQAQRVVAAREPSAADPPSPSPAPLLRRLAGGALLAAALAFSSTRAAVASTATETRTEAAPTPAAAVVAPPQREPAPLEAPPPPRRTAAAQAARPAPVEVDPAVAARRARKDAIAKLRGLAPVRGPQLVAYTEFWELLVKKPKSAVASVLVSSDREAVVATLTNGRRVRAMLPFDPDLVPKLVELGTPFEVAPLNRLRWAWGGVARASGPIICFVGVIWLFQKAMEEPSDDFMSPKAKKAARSTGVTLKDVAGLGQIREEVEELVGYLKNAELYLRLGAQLPAGVLMVGPPGTGKTLLARAIAGEAGVPFFYAAGSEFMEMFVGVGAARVRNLWATARASAPAIIFIDEFDAIGTARNSGMGAGGSEEGANTINQMLTEMDGFDDNKGLVILAATNRPQVLDKALTRPGRFDRWLRLPLPDLPGRVEILQVHARNKAVDPDVDWGRVARACAGWSGADLENLMNEAAISTLRAGGRAVTTEALFSALDNLRRDPGSGQLMLGVTTAAEEEAVAEMGPRTRTVAVAHAAAKALVAHVCAGYDEVQKIHLFPGGEPRARIFFLPRQEALDTGLRTELHLRSEILVTMAGRAAEAMLMGAQAVSDASAPDLEAAAYAARTLVLAMGCNSTLGPVSYMDAALGEAYLSSDMASESSRLQRMSPEVAAAAFAECAQLVGTSEATAAYLLSTHWDAFIDLAEALLEQRSMTGPELATFLNERGARPMDVSAYQGVALDVDGVVVFPEGLPGAQPVLRPQREPLTRLEAVLPGGAEGAEDMYGIRPLGAAAAQGGRFTLAQSYSYNPLRMMTDAGWPPGPATPGLVRRMSIPLRHDPDDATVDGLPIHASYRTSGSAKATKKEKVLKASLGATLFSIFGLAAVTLLLYRAHHRAAAVASAHLSGWQTTYNELVDIHDQMLTHKTAAQEAAEALTAKEAALAEAAQRIETLHHHAKHKEASMAQLVHEAAALQTMMGEMHAREAALKHANASAAPLAAENEKLRSALTRCYGDYGVAMEALQAAEMAKLAREKASAEAEELRRRSHWHWGGGHAAEAQAVPHGQAQGQDGAMGGHGGAAEGGRAEEHDDWLWASSEEAATYAASLGGTV